MSPSMSPSVLLIMFLSSVSFAMPLEDATPSVLHISTFPSGYAHPCLGSSLVSFTVPSTHYYRLAGFGSLCPQPSHHPRQPRDPAAGNFPMLQSGLKAPSTGHPLKLMGAGSSLSLPISEMVGAVL